MSDPLLNCEFFVTNFQIPAERNNFIDRDMLTTSCAKGHFKDIPAAFAAVLQSVGERTDQVDPKTTDLRILQAHRWSGGHDGMFERVERASVIGDGYMKSVSNLFKRDRDTAGRSRVVSV